MTKANRWLLPDGVDEILPPQANRLESLRREILDLYSTWGYELVMTPLIEFLDSLLILPSNELQLQTFKIVDQLTGLGMGVRADITSQVARIDAHVLQQDAPTRLCYADSVLHTKPQSLLGSRSPLMVGAELYGHTGIDSDIEVISLMLLTLERAGINNPRLALGHVSFYRALIKGADLTPELEQKLFAALQSKASGEIDHLVGHSNPALAANLKGLASLHGDISVLDRAVSELDSSDPALAASIAQLRDVSEAINRRFPGQTLYFDLGEMCGFEYHTGIVFAAYIPGYGQAIANGGRYDDIGESFGRARAATGFNADLKTLLAQSGKAFAAPRRIFAPSGDNEDLLSAIAGLRENGEQVIQCLQGQKQSALEMDCTHELINQDAHWQVVSL
jgi:ATP phosphoribosyltransferase regulatory subunit